MTGKTLSIGVAFLTCWTLTAILRVAVAVCGVKHMPQPVVITADLALIAFLFLLIGNLSRLRPVRAFIPPLTMFYISVLLDFGVTVLTTGRYIDGPPSWIAPAVSILSLASGIYGLVVLARFQRQRTAAQNTGQP